MLCMAPYMMMRTIGVQVLPPYAMHACLITILQGLARHPCIQHYASDVMKFCLVSSTGAVAKRKLPLPSDPKALYEPLLGAEGALPFTMEHTDRMR